MKNNFEFNAYMKRVYFKMNSCEIYGIEDGCFCAIESEDDRFDLIATYDETIKVVYMELRPQIICGNKHMQLLASLITRINAANKASYVNISKNGMIAYKISQFADIDNIDQEILRQMNILLLRMHKRYSDIIRNTAVGFCVFEKIKGIVEEASETIIEDDILIPELMTEEDVCEK